MSNLIKPPIDGGPAFPSPDFVHPNGQIEFGTFGMSLRDYFAAKAMAAAQANWPWINASDWYTKVAESAYSAADAMLKAREEAQ
tara:strand:+ start:622 stop:873 length:252 start_codon:yes stop_codon:yes gene_type:complete